MQALTKYIEATDLKRVVIGISGGLDSIAENYSYLSSRLVKEIAELGGSVVGLGPEIVESRLKQRFKKEK